MTSRPTMRMKRPHACMTPPFVTNGTDLMLRRRRGLRRSPRLSPTAHRSLRLEIRTISANQPPEKLLEAWQDLFHRDPNAYALLWPQTVLAQWYASREESTSFTSNRESGLHLLTAWEGDRLHALGVIQPKRVHWSRLTGLPLPGSAGRRLLTGGVLVGGRWLVDTTAESSTCTALMEEALCLVETGELAFLLLEDLEPEMATGRSLTDALALFPSLAGAQPVPDRPRWRIEFPANPATYWDKFSSKTRNSLKRKQKKFPEARLQRYETPEDVFAFLAAARDVSLHTWQTRELGLRIENIPIEQAMFRAQAAAGHFRSYILWADKQPVAFLLGNQAGNEFHYEEVGFDERFADRSPGQILLVKVLDDLIADRTPRWFDFGAGHADYKSLFGNYETVGGSSYVVRKGTSAAWALSLHQKVVDIKRHLSHWREDRLASAE